VGPVGERRKSIPTNSLKTTRKFPSSQQGEKLEGRNDLEWRCDSRKTLKGKQSIYKFIREKKRGGIRRSGNSRNIFPQESNSVKKNIGGPREGRFCEGKRGELERMARLDRH